MLSSYFILCPGLLVSRIFMHSSDSKCLEFIFLIRSQHCFNRAHTIESYLSHLFSHLITWLTIHSSKWNQWNDLSTLLLEFLHYYLRLSSLIYYCMHAFIQFNSIIPIAAHSPFTINLYELIKSSLWIPFLFWGLARLLWIINLRKTIFSPLLLYIFIS